jgi:type VI secretion system protein ImpB
LSASGVMRREREKGITTMARESGQRFIRRNRPPRVHITYEDPYNAERMVELPFVMGVLADLSGNASKVEKPDMEERKFLDVDMDNFESRMAAIEPAVDFKVENKLGEDAGEELSVNLRFKRMDDFGPTAVARQLANLLRYMDGKVAAEDQIKKLLKDPNLMAALNDRLAQKSDGGESGAEPKA